MTMQEMATIYNKFSAAHKYLVGFTHNGQVYYKTVAFAELLTFCKLDRASSKRGGFAKIRVRMSAGQCAQLVENGAILLGNTEMLEADKAHNKGENFERIITEMLTADRWTKDSKPFYECGDIRVNGEEIQIKLNNAELTNEKILGGLVAA